MPPLRRAYKDLVGSTCGQKRSTPRRVTHDVLHPLLKSAQHGMADGEVLRVQRESEGTVVPVICVQRDAPGGKDPQFNHAGGESKCQGMARLVPSNSPDGSRPADRGVPWFVWWASGLLRRFENFNARNVLRPSRRWSGVSTSPCITVDEVLREVWERVRSAEVQPANFLSKPPTSMQSHRH